MQGHSPGVWHGQAWDRPLPVPRLVPCPPCTPCCSRWLQGGLGHPWRKSWESRGYQGSAVWPSSPAASQNHLPGILPFVFLFYSGSQIGSRKHLFFLFRHWALTKTLPLWLYYSCANPDTPQGITDSNSRLDGQRWQSRGPGRGHPVPSCLPKGIGSTWVNVTGAHTAFRR